MAGPQKRLLSLLAAASVAVILATPAVAQATPQFQINGNLAGTAHQQYGALTLKSALFGEWKCRVLTGLAAWNEGGKGSPGSKPFSPTCTRRRNVPVKLS